MQDPTSPRFLLTPLKPGLLPGMAQTLPVLIRVQAPDASLAPGGRRRPNHIALVIDRSGSMSGEPLQEAIRCARYMISRMAATDRVAISVFDHNVKRLRPALPVGDGGDCDRALAGLASGGSTNLHGGWQDGAESLGHDAEQAALARVILLSDGNANAGSCQDTPTIASHCAAAAARGITTSTYGLGHDFNEELMVQMARLGGGNHYYGNTAEDLFEPFMEEFDLISSLCARNLRLDLTPMAGVRIRLLNDYLTDPRDGFPLIRLPDLPFGAEAWALVELEISASVATALTPADVGRPLLQARVTANSPEGVSWPAMASVLSLPILSLPAWEALLQDALVATRRAELEAAAFLREARGVAASGDWSRLDALLAEARQRFAEHAWLLALLENLQEIGQAQDTQRFSKESLYTSRKLGTRLSDKDESAYGVTEEVQRLTFLRRKLGSGTAEFDKRPPKDRQ